MNYKLTCFLAFFVALNYTYAQEGIPIYSDYFSDNYYLVYPSMAGAASSNKLRLTARQQWFGEEEVPNLQTLSFNARIGEQSGLGAIVFNDKNGYHSQKGAYLTYAHHLLFSRSEIDLNQLSFGLSAGFVQSSLDETEFDISDFDPVISGIVQSSSYFNIDFGVSYNFLNFSGHFAVKNLLFQNRDLYTEAFEPSNQRNYLLGGSYVFGNNADVWNYEPSILFQLKERTGEKAIDANFKAYREMNFGKLWGGISYRRSFDGAEYLDGQSVESQVLQNITPILGANYKRFLIAYTYSHQFGNINFDSGGFHQITLGYDFQGKKTKVYDCNCPAVN
ncbi:PorP/SprF family type IX secretion system membrane protein [Marixanthomonas ophiurae]|uniref:Type IX secretion system membrane protein PorP/SprF n=1 Tax=Marixanthomonas ophiurae TaxID=387659 RepID=A0A3E1QBX2_9FLAO|nr:type IX secretion system membrane protein PorP/SprF [Marixanthomonas ophiurae]RFN59628.1 type IX secretion system membrane protein PorP/SprF [Marixanthomonas ophiurae]